MSLYKIQVTETILSTYHVRDTSQDAAVARLKTARVKNLSQQAGVTCLDVSTQDDYEVVEGTYEPSEP